ncbi:MAG: hypothetical protein ACKV2T_11665 [Kofleriaceae bacterium]
MAKHRELAQIVYANTLGRTSASKIWRTVVVAGAMLGAPLSATAGEPPPAAKKEAPPATKPAPRPAKEAVAMPAPPPPDPVDKAAAAKAAKENVKALETEMKDLDKKIVATNKEIKAAKDQAARDTSSAMLAEQKKSKEALKAKIVQAKADSKKADTEAKAEAKAKNPPRPRAKETRPMGRGFILS